MVSEKELVFAPLKLALACEEGVDTTGVVLLIDTDGPLVVEATTVDKELECLTLEFVSGFAEPVAELPL